MVSAEILRTLLYVLAAITGIYATAALLLYLFQSRLIYFPSEHHVGTPLDAGMEYEEVVIRTRDGVSLNAWYVPSPGHRGVLLYFHGNAGNISHRTESLRRFRALGLSTLIPDYRGYGRSEGTPDEEGTYADAEAAWEYLTRERATDPGEIILLGRSLGGAVATYLATTVRPRALIIESTFTSIPDRGAELYPYFPVRLLARIEYNSLGRIPEIRCPILIVHSPEDEIVPFRHGERLFAAAGEPKEFLIIQGGHNDGYFVSAEQYDRALNSFLETYGPK